MVNLGNVTSDVLQGSVLGPTLFLIYVNNLDHSIETHLKKFADDTKLYAKVKNTEQVLSIQYCLDNLLNWGNDQKMLFYPSKC